MHPMFENEKRYHGRKFKIYYMSVDDFIPDLERLGGYLESINDRGEEVVSVIPNTGFEVQHTTGHQLPRCERVRGRDEEELGVPA